MRARCLLLCACGRAHVPCCRCLLLVCAPQIWDSNALEKDDLIGAITLTELEMALVVQQCRDDEGETKPLPRWFSISTGGRVCCIITTVNRGIVELA